MVRCDEIETFIWAKRFDKGDGGTIIIVNKQVRTYNNGFKLNKLWFRKEIGINWIKYMVVDEWKRLNSYVVSANIIKKNLWGEIYEWRLQNYINRLMQSPYFYITNLHEWQIKCTGQIKCNIVKTDDNQHEKQLVSIRWNTVHGTSMINSITLKFISEGQLSHHCNWLIQIPKLLSLITFIVTCIPLPIQCWDT